MAFFIRFNEVGPDGPDWFFENLITALRATDLWSVLGRFFWAGK